MDGQLSGAVHGAVWDVAVDLRRDSARFGQCVAESAPGDNDTLSLIEAAEGFHWPESWR